MEPHPRNSNVNAENTSQHQPICLLFPGEFLKFTVNAKLWVVNLTNGCFTGVVLLLVNTINFPKTNRTSPTSPGGSAGGGPDAAAVRGDRGGLGRLQDLSDGCGAHGVAKLRNVGKTGGKHGKNTNWSEKNWEKHWRFKTTDFMGLT